MTTVCTGKGLCRHHYDRLLKYGNVHHNARLLIQKQAAHRREMENAAFERRFKMRHLVFSRLDNRVSTLPAKEHRFVTSVWRECYDRYLTARALGKKRNGNHLVRYDRPPLAPLAHYRRWWGRQKQRYRSHDIPLMMNERFLRMVEEINSEAA